MDPSWDDDLRLGATKIATASSRRALSESLEAAVRDAHRPPQWTAVPLARDAVRAAAHELRLLAKCLAETAVPAPQGVALAKQLVEIRAHRCTRLATITHSALLQASRIDLLKGSCSGDH